MPTITVNDRLSEALLDAAEGDTGDDSFRTIEDYLDWLENHRELPESSADNKRATLLHGDRSRGRAGLSGGFTLQKRPIAKRRQEDKPK